VKVLRTREVIQVNLNYPVYNWEAAKSGRDKGATRHLISSRFKSYSVNTGDLVKDAKEGGSRKARAV
jgi:hypothetical protein